MKVLVTGASGVVGTALITKLKQMDIEILCQSRRAKSNCANIEWIKHDLLNDSWDALIPNSIDVIFYLAAQTSIYDAISDPISDLNANVLSLLRLLDHCRGWEKQPFFIYTGTVTQVGLVKELPITENAVDSPITFHDLSKLTAENYLKQYIRDNLARGCIFRLANVFGGRQPGQKQDRGILDKIYARALAGEPISVFGPGDYIRDYILVDDVAAALCLAPFYQDTLNGRHFNLGTGVGTTLQSAFEKVAQLASQKTGSTVPIQNIIAPDHLSEIEFRSAVFDISAYQTATGWAPEYNFDQALRKVYSED